MFNDVFWVPIDTAASCVWVDMTWYVNCGAVVDPDYGSAAAVDGSCLEVVGMGTIEFRLWGTLFTEPVRVMSKLPDTVLIGGDFWRMHALVMNLETNLGAISADWKRISGPVARAGPRLDEECLRKVVEDHEVDDHLMNKIDFSEFSKDPLMRQRLKDMLWDKREIFKGMGRISGVKHRIQLKEDAVPVCCTLRRRSPKEDDVKRAAMRKLLEMGILEPAVSPWAANNVFVPKKDGNIRVTSDFRALNNARVTDSYPMEDVREALGWLGNTKIFSTFDLKDGFFQVELEPDSKPYTAIRTVLGLLQYTRLPQGLKNSPGTFQRIVNTILGDRKGKDAMAFIDDTSVGTESEEEHLQSLGEILSLFLAANVRLKFSKCQFGVRSAEVLGHLVDENGLQPSVGHVRAIRALVEPASGDELMRFLGLVNYFSDFVDHFADSARPLYNVLKGTGFSKKRRRGHKLIIPDWDQRWGEATAACKARPKGDSGQSRNPGRPAPRRCQEDHDRCYCLRPGWCLASEDERWEMAAICVYDQDFEEV